MKQMLTIIVITMLSCSGCERDSSKSITDNFLIQQNAQASSGVKVAVTAEQMKASKAKMASQPFAASMVVAAPSLSYFGCPKEIHNSYECYQYREQAIARNTNLIIRKGHSVQLKLLDGKLIHIDDVNEENSDSNMSYSLVSYFPNVQYALLSVQFIEGSTYDLIDLRTGKRTNVGGEVVLSPDNRRFAVFQADIVAGFSSCVLGIYLITPNGLSEEFRITPDDWGPEDDLRWIDGKTIEFNMLSFDGQHYYAENHTLKLLGRDVDKTSKWEIN